MLTLNYLPLHFSLALSIGIILSKYFEIDLNFILILIFSFGSLLIYHYYKGAHSYEPTLYFSFFSFLVFIGIGIVRTESNSPKYLKTHYSKFIEAENKSVIKITKILGDNKTYQKYEADVLEVNKNRTMGMVLLKMRKDSEIRKLRIDDLIYTTAIFLEIRRPLNPYEFDYRNYLRNKGIYHQVLADKDSYISFRSQKKSIKGFASSIRLKIDEELKKKNFSTRELAIVNAILLGQRQEISGDHFRQYRDAGVIHILAISGLHIGILLYFLNIVLKPLDKFKKGEFLKVLLIVFILWSYAILAGLSASVFRAVAMFSAMAIGSISKRRTQTINSLTISFFVLLLYDPFYLFDVGFQLSYSAVFFIIWLQPSVRKLLNPKYKITRYLWNLTAVTITAQIGILPLTIFYFHQFPTMFFASSLVIIPFLGPLLGIGFLVLILAFLGIVPQYFVDFYELILFVLNEFVAIMSGQEFFIIRNISFSIFYLILFTACSVGLGLWIKNKRKSLFYPLLVFILILEGYFIYQKHKIDGFSEVIVFHSYNSTILAERKSNQLFTSTSEDNIYDNDYSPIKDYLNNMPNLNLKILEKRNRVLFFKFNNLMVIDSSGIYSGKYLKPQFVLLINSPKLNIDRMIQDLEPHTIIADGSNAYSMLNRWKRSTQNYGVKFHNTRVDGAFIYKYRQ